jgi:cell division protein FtsB
VRAFLVAALLVAVVATVAAVDRESGLPMWWHLRGELQASGDRLDRLARENEALQAEIDALDSDPFALERAIREDLELARTGEVIVRFTPSSGMDPKFD